MSEIDKMTAYKTISDTFNVYARLIQQAKMTFDRV